MHSLVRTNSLMSLTGMQFMAVDFWCDDTLWLGWRSLLVQCCECCSCCKVKECTICSFWFKTPFHQSKTAHEINNSVFCLSCHTHVLPSPPLTTSLLADSLAAAGWFCLEVIGQHAGRLGAVLRIMRVAGLAEAELLVHRILHLDRGVVDAQPLTHFVRSSQHHLWLMCLSQSHKRYNNQNKVIVGSAATHSDVYSEGG